MTVSHRLLVQHWSLQAKTTSSSPGRIPAFWPNAFLTRNSCSLNLLVICSGENSQSNRERRLQRFCENKDRRMRAVHQSVGADNALYCFRRGFVVTKAAPAPTRNTPTHERKAMK